MLEMNPTTFAITLLCVAMVSYYFGWKRGHVDGHYCERASRGDDND